MQNVTGRDAARVRRAHREKPVLEGNGTCRFSQTIATRMADQAASPGTPRRRSRSAPTPTRCPKLRRSRPKRPPHDQQRGPLPRRLHDDALTPLPQTPLVENSLQRCRVEDPIRPHTRKATPRHRAGRGLSHGAGGRTVAGGRPHKPQSRDAAQTPRLGCSQLAAGPPLTRVRTRRCGRRDPPVVGLEGPLFRLGVLDWGFWIGDFGLELRR